MSSDDSFDELIGRLRAGDEDAAGQIFERFAQRLVGLARARLDQFVRRKLDPEEVVQSVYGSFFRRFAEGQFELKNWDSLWTLLTLITVRKCGHQIDYFQAACRDVRHEAPAPVTAEDSTASWEAIARDPTPSEAAMLAETVEHLLRMLDDRQRQIVLLRLQGHGPLAISTKVGCSERTVKRVLEHVRKWLQRRHADGGEGT
jgi:RNA polymerase sigma-70 factor (ECF subfamily)